jgi:hypothetical protein
MRLYADDLMRLYADDLMRLYDDEVMRLYDDELSTAPGEPNTTTQSTERGDRTAAHGGVGGATRHGTLLFFVCHNATTARYDAPRIVGHVLEFELLLSQAPGARCQLPGRGLLRFLRL